MQRPPIEEMEVKYLCDKAAQVCNERRVNISDLSDLISWIKHLESQNQWIKCSDRLPEHGKEVLALMKYSDTNRQTMLMGCYLERFTEESDLEAESYDEYCEEDDTYYMREGWFELIANWPDFYCINVCEGTVTHWMPLPLPPEDSE